MVGYGMRSDERYSIPKAVYAGLDSSSSFIRNVQKLTIEELIELYAYAEAIVETVREPLVVLDKDLIVKSVNKGFLTTFQVKEKDTVGKKIFDLGNGQWNIPELNNLLYSILPKKKTIENFEVDHVFPHIGQKVMLLNARTIILAQYRTQLILLAIEDVTEKKLIEERTEKFISIASHELKTPITSIMGFMQLLERKLNKGMDKATSYMMSRVIYQMNVLNDLINDLFDARKIKQGELIIKKRSIKIEPIVEEAVTFFQYLSTKHKIVVEGTTESKIYADKKRIMQVITNLLYNAVKYSPDKDIIKVKTAVKNGKAVVSVQDFGIGIKKSEQKHIFESFFTGKKDKSKTGLGLGLYICAQIIKLHDGEIWFESVPSKGTTFYFSLPIK